MGGFGWAEAAQSPWAEPIPKALPPRTPVAPGCWSEAELAAPVWPGCAPSERPLAALTNVAAFPGRAEGRVHEVVRFRSYLQGLSNLPSSSGFQR